ncbi:MAG: hypothetical protein A2381_16570 [Bdellovibrionales bacterium RIFOXYB1_FULL_37_110]|nr:MAG: hypothetical protein A2181_07575 [Bdellovibrionales bacterium RIFOXYA1_FULL_38_20]OFZ50012.1 MAG: hypothetical protein A2417_18405 [Bdellovibrionales bacterium RIFOXYC1_FULL_37_79]OFZ59918.1 MAG: hypothetical protein A2381_16570 [Bdellovibrionales bacterium RIFOXYB1_FULL_37_110]OFZ63889.1 MAG: hypothetical protein A2577_05760 [Bdellovibrionales bacterium RIFOXYD1_FULL_36_51]
MIQLSPAEQETIYGLAEKILGISQKGKFRKNILVRNIELRISQTKKKNLSEYLNLVNSDKMEYCHFVSALTIHTTNWFREPPHFVELEKYLKRNMSKLISRPFVILSAACSTGEESFSLGLLMEKIKREHPEFDYRLIANDIDPVSVSHAKRSLFPKAEVSSIPKQYHPDILIGKNQFEDFFTVAKNIRERITFTNENILHLNLDPAVKFDIIFCRNVLIYFEFENIQKIVNVFISRLQPNGILCLGHSEALNSPETFGLKLTWNSSYIVAKSNDDAKNKERKLNPPSTSEALHESLKEDANKYDTLANENTSSSSLPSKETKPKTILVVDDSITVRKVLEKLYQQHGFKVLLAQDAKQANVLLTTYLKDISLISLDLHMPEISGQEWLSQIRSRGITIPVIVITDAHSDEAFEVLGALERGAQDYLNKSELHQDANLAVEKVKAIIESHEEGDPLRQSPSHKVTGRQTLFRPDVILIGASTGGPEALTKLLENFNHNSPPILIVQHIAPSFADAFYKRLCKVSTLSPENIADGIPLKPGHLYAATQDFHIGVAKNKNSYTLITDKCDPINRHRPSVDYLYKTCTGFADRVAGILLTGMGADGAEGLSQLRCKGAITFVQNENSCVVFGMPKEAIKRNAHGFVGDLTQIRNQMNLFIKL